MPKKRKSKTKHLSLSDVQAEAERKALEIIRNQNGYKGIEQRKVKLGQGTCQPDGISPSGKTVVEVYARVGTLKGAQSKKIAADILKLATIRQQTGYENARCVIFFVDGEARDSIRGWMKEAAKAFGVKLETVPNFPNDLRKRLLDAQRRQKIGSTKHRKA